MEFLIRTQNLKILKREILINTSVELLKACFKISIMSIHYQIIYADLLEDEPEEVEFPQLPELDSFDLSGKIAILKTYLRRSRMRGKRTHTLFYTF